MNATEYRDTGEHNLIRGITGNVIKIPLVIVKLISICNNNGEILCGLIDHLPQSIDILVAADVDSRGVCEQMESFVVNMAQNNSLVEL